MKSRPEDCETTLAEKQAFPLTVKVKMSLHRIREWYEYFDGKVYVAWSKGKDSTVLAHLVQTVYPEVPLVYFDTGLEYPEIRNFESKCFRNVVTLKPKMQFRKVLDHYGFPVVSKRVAQYVGEVKRARDPHGATVRLRMTGIRKNGFFSPMSKIPNKWQYLCQAPFKISEKCCDAMKKRPAKRYHKETGRLPYLGIMASEGKQREKSYLLHGCNALKLKEDSRRSNPLSFWLESDVWEYLHGEKVPYSAIYDMGYRRTGCMFCMFGVHLEKEPNRFQRMQETHPKQWIYCLDKLGLRRVLEYINVPYENRSLF